MIETTALRATGWAGWCSRENSDCVLRIASSIRLKIITDEEYGATVSQSKRYASANKTETGT